MIIGANDVEVCQKSMTVLVGRIPTLELGAIGKAIPEINPV